MTKQSTGTPSIFFSNLHSMVHREGCATCQVVCADMHWCQGLPFPKHVAWNGVEVTVPGMRYTDWATYRCMLAFRPSSSALAVDQVWATDAFLLSISTRWLSRETCSKDVCKARQMDYKGRWPSSLIARFV